MPLYAIFVMFYESYEFLVLHLNLFKIQQVGLNSGGSEGMKYIVLIKQ